MDILKERYSLVQERIAEISQETEKFQNENERYWHLTARLALGEKTEDLSFMDYTVCDSVFGEKGRYLCLLFAQMMQVSGFLKKNETELVCVCCELFTELYRIVLDGEEIKAIRNTLYWFYSDYCELFSSYWLESLQNDRAVIFGGPMLLREVSAEQDAVWLQHTEDFGLYMGSRFEERCYQAVMLAAKKNIADICRKFADMLLHADNLKTSSGFRAADRQWEGLVHLANRILAGINEPNLRIEK